ncbi:uncharacterized protein LOC130747065 [Lotus japonicus]|uniref:uncharacterized protein LOC130747065 n=1 Tax=Lotus japonicus TaxID=34305 RepID=UPI00258AE6B3|nr:uncharacterized protein LOC130747065 [Lotus japonicus]
MTRQIIVSSNPVRRQHRRRVGEVAGGATGKCAAVCCCCPFAVINFVVLAVYTVPKGLFRKAVERRRRRLTVKKSGGGRENEAVLLQTRMSSGHFEAVAPTLLEEHLANDRDAEEKKTEAVELEREMWARFNGTGFWRSESQREP